MDQLVTSSLSFAALNLRDRCWFIFARGATPARRISSAKSICKAIARPQCIHQRLHLKEEEMQTVKGHRKKANTVNGHEEEFLGLDYLKQLLQVVEDLYDHLRFCELCAWIIAMRAVVDDPVHVQIQVVHFWHVGLCNRLIDERVSLAQPSIKLRNTCWHKINVIVYNEAPGQAHF